METPNPSGNFCPKHPSCRPPADSQAAPLELRPVFGPALSVHPEPPMQKMANEITFELQIRSRQKKIGSLVHFNLMPALRCEKNCSRIAIHVGSRTNQAYPRQDGGTELRSFQSAWIRGTRPIPAIIEFGSGTSLPCCVQSVSRKRTVFGKRNIGLQTRRQYFDTVVTPVACFGAGVQTRSA